MTPIHDVLSAYPVLGDGGSQVSAPKVKLAMAMRSKNAHWKIQEIQRRHWTAVAQRHGLSDELSTIADELIGQTARAVTAAGTALPKGFPAHVPNRFRVDCRSGSRMPEV